LPSALDVSPDALVTRTAAELKKIDVIKTPDWVLGVKTGSHNERRSRTRISGSFVALRCCARCSFMAIKAFAV